MVVIYGCKVLLLGGVYFGGGLVCLYIDLIVIVDVLDCFLFVKKNNIIWLFFF